MSYSQDPLAVALVVKCPKCSSDLVVRSNKLTGDKFIGCSGYPTCKYSTQYDYALDHIYEKQQRLENTIKRLEAQLGGRPQPCGPNPSLRSDLKRALRFTHPDVQTGEIKLDEITYILTRAITELR